MKHLKKITDVTDLKGKYVVVREDLNVPIKDGQVMNQYRIARALPTLQHLSSAGARVIVISHIGREPHETLRPVYEALRGSLPAVWAGGLLGDDVQAARDRMSDGEVLILENVRSDAREVANDISLAEDLARLGDIFVQDAFAVAHREQASVVGIPQFLPSYAGVNFLMEFEELKRSLTPEHPSLFVLGGAKFETKLPLIIKFLDTYDHIFIGGALVHDVMAARGMEVGKSLRSNIDLSDSEVAKSDRVLLPIDVVVKRGNDTVTIPAGDVLPDDVIFDAGPETTNMMSLYLRGAKTILWNGPLGNYEEGFVAGTEAFAKAVADADGYSVVGGGDTIASIEELGLGAKFGFLSTGGGAMLSFLEHGTLPALEALENCTKS